MSKVGVRASKRVACGAQRPRLHRHHALRGQGAGARCIATEPDRRPAPSDRHNRVAALGNIFSEFTALANAHGAENLGQGFPSFGAPDFLTDGVDSLCNGDLYSTELASHTLAHQYTVPGCEPELASTIVAKCSPYFGRALDTSNVNTTVGAQEALYNIMNSLCNPRDEVVVLTPAYDAYFKGSLLLDLNMKTIALEYDHSRLAETGGALNANHYTLDYDVLERTLTDETKVLFLNSPSSPFGKTFTAEELEKIASIVKKFPNLVVVSDEVYEHMVFDGAHGHVHAAAIGDMWEQTLSVFSVGKTFSCTGWRVGYVVGPERLITPLKCLQAATSFGTSTPLQKLAANAFKSAATNGYYQWLPAILGDKCAFLHGVVERAGFDVVKPNGGYFFCADFSQVADRLGLLEGVPGPERSREFCRWLTTEIGVTPLPINSFYGAPEDAVPDTGAANETLIRFAFCKSDSMLEQAAQNLRRLAAPNQRQDTIMHYTASRNPEWIRCPNPNVPAWLHTAELPSARVLQ